MSDLYNRIVNNRGSFERLIARLPGFKGYQDKQARRKADTMLRDYISAEVDKRLQRLVRIEKLILDNLGMEYMPRTRSTKGKMQLYRDKMTAATSGYSGMWAQMKIDDVDMDMLYSFDEAQMLYIDKFDVALDKLEGAALKKEGVDEAIYELDTLATEALEAFAMREDVLNNLANSI